jgi:DnaJ-class molecular chaperone
MMMIAAKTVGASRFFFSSKKVLSYQRWTSPSPSKCWGSSGTNVDPFLVLGLSRQQVVDYATVKSAFLKAAMAHHPDQSSSGSGEAFLRVRAAFEQIVATLKDANTEGRGDDQRQPVRMYQSEQEFQAWFRSETQQFLSFKMSDATVNEVVNVYKTMTSGGKDKGGYWEMARLVTERHQNAQNEQGRNNNKKDDPIAQITGGTGQEQSLHMMRRKRKR